jgi:YebC/PmpR family DNA-binding regulatory protein
VSGHSKWSTIKHQKGVADARRGQLFTKLTRAIIVAVQQKGSNPELNFHLGLAIQKARDNNMPMENIERAIKRGSGETEGATLIEMVLEGYGPGGAAIMAQVLTDNRNRTLQDVRYVFNRHGGSLGESGCVTWLFSSKGLIRVKVEQLNAEELALEAIDAGAEDVKMENDFIEIYTKPEDLKLVRSAVERKKRSIESAELCMLPNTIVEIDEKVALQLLKLLDRLEELDEVQSVYTNADFPLAVLEKYQLKV